MAPCATLSSQEEKTERYEGNSVKLSKTANKLGAILFQLPPSFTVSDFMNIEQFLDRLPTADSYDYAVEFRHPSWGTEGPWEMLKHYDIAAVMTDSPPSENLQYLSGVIVTAESIGLENITKNIQIENSNNTIIEIESS